MITPTAGRVVWYFKSPNENESGFARPANEATPLAAIIAYVHSDRMVNLTVFDANGVPHPRTSVPLVQEGDEIPGGSHCEWMPYQKGQAAKTEQAEKAAAGIA